ncbi:hypothetical protein M3Y95_00742800 [Aphelenchoides besseyi]|nr:hypothetical protein M3Y95_00742800 [Aphelenchoides besseyi]
MPKRQELLSANETFARYERRSPTFAAADPYRQHSPIGFQTPLSEPTSQFVVTEFAPAKRKINYKWIVAIAIAVPVFVMFVLFFAVWLQELGWI